MLHSVIRAIVISAKAHTRLREATDPTATIAAERSLNIVCDPLNRPMKSVFVSP